MVVVGGVGDSVTASFQQVSALSSDFIWKIKRGQYHRFTSANELSQCLIKDHKVGKHIRNSRRNILREFSLSSSFESDLFPNSSSSLALAFTCS